MWMREGRVTVTDAGDRSKRPSGACELGWLSVRNREPVAGNGGNGDSCVFGDACSCVCVRVFVQREQWNEWKRSQMRADARTKDLLLCLLLSGERPTVCSTGSRVRQRCSQTARPEEGLPKGHRTREARGSRLTALCWAGVGTPGHPPAGTRAARAVRYSRRVGWAAGTAGLQDRLARAQPGMSIPTTHVREPDRHP